MENLLPLLDVRLLWALMNSLSNGKEVKTPGRTAVALWFVQSGSISVRLSDEETQAIRLTPGSAVVMATNGTRRIEAEGSNTAQWLSIGFAFRLFAQDHTLRLLPRLLIWRPDGESANRLVHLMEAAILHCGGRNHTQILTPSMSHHASRNAEEQWASDGIARALIYQVWQQVALQNVDTLPSAPETPRRLLLSLLHAQKEVVTASVKSMAQAADISESHLTRLFRQHLDTTPQKQLLRIRLETASFALRDTQETTEVISAMVGFASLSHFTRAFAERYGLPPAKYRQQQRATRW